MAQILVLGMHRSGTSAITRLIAMMGAYFGPESIALPPDKDNPKGFWERRDVLACNRELLRLSGCVWHVVHRWDAQAVRVPLPLANHMRDIVAEMDRHDDWVLKDPRFCLTLPVWRPLLTSCRIVLAYRDPSEIAQSLHQRNGMPLEYGLALWEFHTVHAIRAVHNLPVLFVDYKELLTNAAVETKQLHESLQAMGAKNLHLPGEQEIWDFIDPRLHRAKGGLASIALNAFQERIAAMWRGDIAMDARVEVSVDTMQILQHIGSKVSGAPL